MLVCLLEAHDLDVEDEGRVRGNNRGRAYVPERSRRVKRETCVGVRAVWGSHVAASQIRAVMLTQSSYYRAKNRHNVDYNVPAAP
jgi:hypothetical protein